MAAITPNDPRKQTTAVSPITMCTLHSIYIINPLFIDSFAAACILSYNAFVSTEVFLKSKLIYSQGFTNKACLKYVYLVYVAYDNNVEFLDKFSFNNPNCMIECLSLNVVHIGASDKEMYFDE